MASHAAQSGIQLITYRELSAQILDGHPYVNQLLREQNSNERYRPERFVEPRISYDTTSVGVPAFRIIDEWLNDEAMRQLTLLGDVGTGKTFLSRMIANRLGEEFLAEPMDKPLPLLVDLRHADRQFSLEGILSWHFAQTGLEQVTFRVFQHALSEGRIVLLLDGFDEMAAKVNDQITIRNFHELSRCVQGRAKVLLTCRTHYFRSRAEEESVILGRASEDEADIARGLYWDLVTRRGFQIAYVRPFDLLQVEDFVAKANPTSTKKTLEKIRSTYNLTELSQRPMLLDMIVETIDRLGDSAVNPAGLYELFTQKWINRDVWRGTLSAQEKLEFLTVLALRLWGEDSSIIHYSELATYVQGHFGTRLRNPTEMVEVDAEVRTATFLVRNDSGHYGFAHKSYTEFFIARYIVRALTQQNVDALAIHRVSPEVIRFFCDLVGSRDEQFSALLETVLLAPYRRQLSENALLLLYALKLQQTAKPEGETLVVKLPTEMRLEGAELSGLVLEGAMFVKARLSYANLHEAMLKGADFRDADLGGANCEGANFNGANLTNANLEDANLRACTFEWASGLPVNLHAHAPSVEPDLVFLYNAVERRAAWFGFAHGVDPNELASQVWLRLVELKPHGLSGLNDMNRDALDAYIRTMMRNIVVQQRTRAQGHIPLDEIPDDQLSLPDDTSARAIDP